MVPYKLTKILKYVQKQDLLSVKHLSLDNGKQSTEFLADEWLELFEKEWKFKMWPSFHD